MERIEVRASDGVRLAGTVHDSDPGAPTVVLVHGFPDTSRVWDEVVEVLAPSHRVVTYDVRGAGGSDAPVSRRGYRLPQLADDLVAVLDAVSPDAPAHVVGHDWGGIQAFEAATTPHRAARMASFTCISGASFDHAGRMLRRDLAATVRRPFALADVVGQLARSWYILLFQLPVLPEQSFERGVGARVLEMMEPVPHRDGHPADTFVRDGSNGVNLYRANLGRVLRPRRDRVHVPVQVVVGEGDPVLTPHLFDELAVLADDAWLRVVDGAHWLPRTHPEVVAGNVADVVAHVAGGDAPGLHGARLTAAGA